MPPMGHRFVLYNKDYNILFIDSFGINPKFYGRDIKDFYALYPGCKNMMLKKPIQNEFSYVCGAYCVVTSYFLSKNYTINRFKSVFIKNTRKIMLILLGIYIR